MPSTNLAMLVALGFAGVATAQVCANTTAQCAGTGGSAMDPLPCCDPSAKCEIVNEFFSKCVFQPTCAAANEQCAGAGDTVMEPTPCCDAGFVCQNASTASQFYWTCIDGSGPPPTACAHDGEQCGGTSTSEGTAIAALLVGPTASAKSNVDLPCCEPASKCEIVNQFYSKCVAQPTCVLPYSVCNGTADHVFEPTPCCEDGYQCVPWGEQWYECRETNVTTCSRHTEQCAGTGGSAMPAKACCEADDVCIKMDEYYSKCDKPPPSSHAKGALA